MFTEETLRAEIERLEAERKKLALDKVLATYQLKLLRDKLRRFKATGVMPTIDYPVEVRQPTTPVPTRKAAKVSMDDPVQQFMRTGVLPPRR